jgi:hypothetical protein
VSFFYTTTTLGIDPSYASEAFYNKILNNDTQRIIDRFRNANNDKVCLTDYVV